MRTVRTVFLACLVICIAAGSVRADKTGYLTLARQGWSYELRTTMLGRDMTVPVHINGRDLSGAALCLIGEPPQKQSLAVINAFRDLVRHTFGKPLPMRYAGPAVRACGSGRTVILRLFSGQPPHRALTDDLNWMNEVYALGLPRDRWYFASSPAMAQTFFGRRGQGTHIMVKQPVQASSGALETAFYRSILIEELFQSFTFGMDIMLFDRRAAFQSKLQETPLNLRRLPWESRAFMKALLRSNPGGLCDFDVFMMHAVAEAPVDQTNGARFIDFIDSQFDRLRAMTDDTLTDPRFALILDRSCRPTGG